MVIPKRTLNRLEKINTIPMSQYRANQRLQQLSNILRPNQLSAEKSLKPETPFKIAVIGSGNWGTTIAKVLAENTAEKPDTFAKQVDMWVFQEKIDGTNLTEIINNKHENVKYLPGVKLPENLHAEPDIVKAAQGADLLVFN